jgi:hypothetical protein
MPRIELLFPILLVVGLSGCAGMSEQECMATDWRSVGFEDGTAGRSEASIGNYRQACGQHGVAPNLEQYRLGHSEGVESYCRPARGFEVGARGQRYQGVCPAQYEPEFLAAYSDGRHLYVLETSVRTIDNQIAARHRRLEVIKRDITSAAAAIIADGTAAERRAELLLETAALAEESNDIEDELESLELERLVREDELLGYQDTLAFAQ